MGIRSSKKRPEYVLDTLVIRQQNALNVFETVASNLEEIAAEAAEVADVAAADQARLAALADIAAGQAEEARARADRIRGLLA